MKKNLNIAPEPKDLRAWSVPDYYLSSSKGGNKGFVCLHCGHDKNGVIDSRFRGEDSPHVWRRRVCLSCGARFSTYEIRAHVYDRLIASSGAKLIQKIEKAIKAILDEHRGQIE